MSRAHGGSYAAKGARAWIGGIASLATVSKQSTKTKTTCRDDHRRSNATSRPRSMSFGTAAAASSRRWSALTYDDLTKEIKLVIHCVKRAEFSSTMPPRRASRRDRADSSRPRTSCVARDGASARSRGAARGGRPILVTHTHTHTHATQVIKDYVEFTDESLAAIKLFNR